MKTLEMTAVVGPDRKLTVQLPPDINPGAHRLVVVIEEALLVKPPSEPLNLPLLQVDSWPADLSLRREDMYGDWGR